jgi:hypothetical protein
MEAPTDGFYPMATKKLEKMRFVQELYLLKDTVCSGSTWKEKPLF